MSFFAVFSTASRLDKGFVYVPICIATVQMHLKKGALIGFTPFSPRFQTAYAAAAAVFSKFNVRPIKMIFGSYNLQVLGNFVTGTLLTFV